MFACLLRDERGAVLSAELVLVLSILVLGVIVGLSEVAVAVNTELNDVSNAIGALDQSYFFTGFRNFEPKCPSHVAGSRFTDLHDDCDKNVSCDLVCGPANAKFGIGGLPDADTCG
jgi:Flp pilus assembly pilin Flp